MIGYIEKPHLPKGKVKHIILGKKYRKLLENALFEHDLHPIWLSSNSFVDERISGHADISALHAGANKLYLADYLSDCEIIDKVSELGFEPNFVQTPSGAYPDDCALNFCILNDKLIYNPKSASDVVISKINYNECISVNQGYTKCSVCVVDESAIITQDILIAQKAENAGIAVLYINEPFVRLDGFESGFIGGASFKTDKDKLAFTGTIKNDSIRNNIESFLAERNIKAVYLTDEEIYDIGGGIPLTEEIT